MVRKRTAYARVARTAGRGLEPLRLSYAILQRDLKLAAEAVDWPAFRASLVAAGFDEPAAARLAAEARFGLAEMVKAGALSEQQIRAHFGLTGAQARQLLQFDSYMRSKKVPPERAASLLAQRARGLVGTQLDPRPRPLELATRQADLRRIDRIAASLESRAERALRAASAELRQRVAGIARHALGLSDEAAMARMLGEQAGRLQVEAVLRAGLERAGEAAARQLASGSGAPALFQARDPRIERWVAERAAELNGWFRDSAERAAAEILAGTRDLPLEERARLLAARIDLSAKDNAGLLSANGPTSIDRRMDRVESFAASQTYAAAQEGQRLAWRQAEESGVVRQMARYWVTRDDGRECERCGPMHGQKRAVGEPFESRGAPGAKFMNPGDTHAGWKNPCRCGVVVLGFAA